MARKAKNKIETICVAASEIKMLDNEENSDFYIIEGLGAAFDNIDRVDDVIRKGAFNKTIRNRKSKVKMLFNHNSDDLMGVWDTMIERDEGLFVKGKMHKEDPLAQRMKRLIDMGALDSMSIGYRVKDYIIDDGIRIIKEMDLHEVSLVPFPANEEAVIMDVKSVDDVKDWTKKDVEEFLRETGELSRKSCTLLASRFQDPQSDSVDDEEKDDQTQSDSDDDSQKLGDEYKGSIEELLDEVKNLQKAIQGEN